MKFRFSGTLLRFVDYRKEIELEAETLGIALEKLARECPLLSAVIYDGQGRVLSTHRLFLGGALIRDPDLALGLKNTDCIDVITAIAGG